MKFWIAQDDDGLVYLSTVKPKRVPLAYDKHIKVWVIEAYKGVSVCLNNDMNSQRILREDGNIDKVYLADIIGFKRKGIKQGIIRWEGFSMREAKEVEIDFLIKK